MRVKKDNYCGLNIPEFQREQLIDSFAGLNNDGINVREFSRRDIAHIYFNETKDNYLICESTKKTIKDIKLSNGFFQYLKLEDKQYATLLINDREFFRFLVNGDLVHCVHVTKESAGVQGDYFKYDGFSIDFKERYVSHGNEFHVDTDIATLPDLIREFLKAAIYIFCTDTEVEYVNSGTKNHKPKNDGKVVNDSPYDLRVVHSKWNIKTVKTDGFGVRGHLRFQPYGEKLTKVKVIFIEPFMKGGYTREIKS